MWYVSVHVVCECAYYVWDVCICGGDVECVRMYICGVY